MAHIKKFGIYMELYPAAINELILCLKKLPGVGSKTAQRFAFQLLDWKEHELQKLSSTLSDLKKRITICEECGAITQISCPFCSKERERAICIVSSPREIFLIEETKSYKGYYHVLNHLISPMEGKLAEDLHLEKLERRIKSLHIEEIIIALDSSLEGDTTSLYLKKIVESWGVKTTRLAFGIPVGSSLEYADEGTLARALLGRQLA